MHLEGALLQANHSQSSAYHGGSSNQRMDYMQYRQCLYIDVPFWYSEILLRIMAFDPHSINQFWSHLIRNSHRKEIWIINYNIHTRLPYHTVLEYLNCLYKSLLKFSDPSMPLKEDIQAKNDDSNKMGRISEVTCSILWILTECHLFLSI